MRPNTLHNSRVLLVAALTAIGTLTRFDTPDAALVPVHALFDLGAPASGPFPSDWFTVVDPSHNTGRRVNLPLPDCAVRISDCEDLDVLNTLDGFNLQPRLSIPFDGAIDVESVTSDAVFLISLGSMLGHGHQPPTVVGINQIVWDPETTTLHVESDELLDQHTRYALIITNRLRDPAGGPVEASEAFRRFRQTVRGEYKHALLDAIHAARRLGIREDHVAVASVFTTQSATAVLEKIRDQFKAQIPEPADFFLGSQGERTVFLRNEVAGITFRQQTRDNPPAFIADPVPVHFLDIIPGTVGAIAFGKYRSPDYRVHPGEFIPPVATRTGTPEVQETNDIYFNLLLPSGEKPAGGWPVAIFATGGGARTSKQGPNQSVFSVAASMAVRGIASVAINAVGQGWGSLGTLTVNRTVGAPVTLSAGGRGIDQNGDGVIENPEGLEAASPRAIIARRDGQRQTVVDLMQLVRVIELGVDTDGDGSADLDPQRVYYSGVSFGGIYGTVFLGVEPAARVGVLNDAGARSDEWSRFGVSAARPRVGNALNERSPSLINPPGLTQLDGISVAPPHFNENKPLRHQPPVINTVPGAISIQTYLEHQEWVGVSGDPVAYVSHLRKAPLPGMPAKWVIYQFGKGDRAVVNPSTTALLRAGELADRAVFFRNDLAVSEDATVPRNPHTFMMQIDNPSPLARAIAHAAQERIATFFASDGTVIIHPEPARFFEVPIMLPLPERPNFIP